MNGLLADMIGSLVKHSGPQAPPGVKDHNVVLHPLFPNPTIFSWLT